MYNSLAHDDSGRFQSAAEADYTNPSKEQVLRADLEERWQDESPQTARMTDLADDVDVNLGTRKRAKELFSMLV